MENKKVWQWAFINAVGVFFYVVLVALLMTNSEKIFGQMNTFFGPAAILLLFVFSALVCGLLVFGRPVYLFLNNFKKEAVKMLLCTVVSLFAITVLAFVVNLLVK